MRILWVLALPALLDAADSDRSLQGSCTFNSFTSGSCPLADLCETLATEVPDASAVDCDGSLDAWTVTYTYDEACTNTPNRPNVVGEPYNRRTFDPVNGYCFNRTIVHSFSGLNFDTQAVTRVVTRPDLKSGMWTDTRGMRLCNTQVEWEIYGDFSYCVRQCPISTVVNNVACNPGCLVCNATSQASLTDCSNINENMVEKCGRGIVNDFTTAILDFFAAPTMMTPPPVTLPPLTPEPTMAPVETESPVETSVEAPVEGEVPVEAPVEGDTPVAAPVEGEVPVDAPVEEPGSTEAPAAVNVEVPSDIPLDPPPLDPPVAEPAAAGSSSAAYIPQIWALLM